MRHIFLILFIIPIICSAQPVTDGLVGYWPFNGNANDASGNGHDGTVTGAILTTDRFGSANSAYYFDGIDDKISISPSIGSFSEVTMCAWVNLNSNNSRQNIYSNFEFYSQTDNGGFLFDFRGDEGNVLRFASFNNIVTDVRYEIPEFGTWIFVCGRYSSIDNKISLWINGSMVNEKTCAPPRQDYQSIIDGISSSTYPIYGKLDDIRIYNRALSATEISQIYDDRSSSLPSLCNQVY